MTKTKRVAVMLDLEWPYKRHAAIFAGTQKFAQEHDWESVVDEYADDTLPSSSKKEVPYDGIIARANLKLAQRATRLNVPVVNVWYNSPACSLLPGVFPDCQSIGRLRAEHLLARGLRRFAVLTAYNDRAQDTERKAFLDAVGGAGGSCHVEKIALNLSSSVKQWRKTEQTIAAWMDKWVPPVGVFVSSETGGRLVAQMCRNRGWRVPEDVSIIAGMNEEALCEHIRPTLTSVDAGYERIGYAAAELLDRMMKGETPPKEPILLQPTGLVLRESTDFYAVENDLVAAAMKFIAEKSHLSIGAEDVAKAVNSQTRTLQRYFRKHLNRPVATEIRRVRMERAKRELVQSRRSLKEIARDVGFGEAMRMYEVFRRELGITPSDYRQQRRKA